MGGAPLMNMADRYGAGFRLASEMGFQEGSGLGRRLQGAALPLGHEKHRHHPLRGLGWARGQSDGEYACPPDSLSAMLGLQKHFVRSEEEGRCLHRVSST